MEELYLTLTCYNGHHDLCLLFMGSGLSVALGQELPWLMNFHMNENTAKEQGWEPKGGMHTFHNHLFPFYSSRKFKNIRRWQMMIFFGRAVRLLLQGCFPSLQLQSYNLVSKRNAHSYSPSSYSILSLKFQWIDSPIFMWKWGCEFNSRIFNIVFTSFNLI